MPSFIFGRVDLEYATEEELLAFANKLRKAGAAEPLDALMPSRPNDTKQCLIANACNFSCAVEPYGAMAGDWYLVFPWNMPEAECRQIAEEVGCSRHHASNGNWHYIALPRRIANTAAAFDNGAGWTTKYRKVENA